jgi:hypothetical protein
MSLSTGSIGESDVICIGGVQTSWVSIRCRENITFDLHPVTFYYKNESEKIPQSGSIAEEASSIFTDLIVLNDRGEPENVHSPLLLNEVQNNNKIIDGILKYIKKQLNDR